MDVQIIVAAHKPYPMPKDSIYLPVQVGSAGKSSIGYTRDDSGDNISNLNPYYCELTGLYWAWKNMTNEYIGLAHYRRHFRGKKGILSREEAEELLSVYPILVPTRRRYYIETIGDHYSHTHYEKDSDMTRAVVAELCPKYLPAFDKHMARKWSHMFNMFIMRKDLADAYCSFLFPILFELQKRTDLTEYDPFQARLFGRISEMLLDIWLETNNLPYKEIPWLTTEKTPWIKKGSAFLRAKFLGQKYKGSF